MSIAIVNASTLVSDEIGSTIVSALNLVLPAFCQSWGLQPYTAVYIGKDKATAIRLRVYILDLVGTKPTILAYHTVSDDTPYGVCFVKSVLAYGGTLIYSTSRSVPTLAQSISHEIFELLIDPNCNNWWDIGDGKTLIAKEVSDPVQANLLTVNVEISPEVKSYNIISKKTIIVKPAVNALVTLSDWVLPSWAIPQRKTGPFNFMNTLKGPFAVDKGGYVSTLTNGTSGQVKGMIFADDLSEEDRERLSKEGRL